MSEGPAGRVRQAGLVLLALTVASVSFSIAIAEIFLALSAVAWTGTLAIEKRRPRAPAWMLPLLLYAGWTLVSAALSPDRATSFTDCKQLVLLLVVPIAYEVVGADAAVPLTTVLLGAGAVSAMIGIGQYSILHFDNLGQRPRGTLGLYMTFSGLMMLVLNLAVARVLFLRRARIWPTLVMPALAVVLALSLSRNAWVGAGFAVALLLVMRDFRLTALVPVAVALFFLVAPGPVIQRFYSIFDSGDPTNRDRLAMMRAGGQIVQAHPIAGVGPNMVARIYPQYRQPDAVTEIAPHLHNVPLQIAAERGLPALGLWLWFIGAVTAGATAIFRTSSHDGPARFLAATALASVVAMLGAGMFEHNFGDSEFQILFLALVTLPFAVLKEALPHAPVIQAAARTGARRAARSERLAL